MIGNKLLLPSLLLILPAGTALALHAYLGSFTRFLADDYCSAYYADRLGLFRSIWYWYLNWSGRYAAFAADWLMEKLGAHALPVLPPLFLLIWLAAASVAIDRFLRHGMSPAKSVPIAISSATLFVFVVLQLSPDIPQSFYWWNGMRAYTLPLILLTCYAILFQVGVERLQTKGERVAGSLLSFLFLFVIGGFSETYAAFQVALLAFLSVFAWFFQKSIRTAEFQFLAAGLIGSLFAVGVVAWAPGNAIRQGYYPPHPDLITLFQISFRGYRDFLFAIVRTPEKITAFLGALFASFWFGAQSEHRLMENHVLFPLLFLGAFLLSFACFLPSAYAVSDVPVPRSLIVPVFILVAALLGGSFLWGLQFKAAPALVGSSVLFIAIPLLAYSAAVHAQGFYNSRLAYVEFAQKWDATDALIWKARAANMETVQIPGMDNWAGVERPTPSKTYWPNICYSLYYGIQVFGPRYD